MQKTASQIADEVLEKVAVTPGQAHVAILKRLDKVLTSQATYDKALKASGSHGDILRDLMKKYPRTFRRAIAAKADSSLGTSIKEHRAAKWHPLFKEYYKAVKPTPGGKYFERTYESIPSRIKEMWHSPVATPQNRPDIMELEKRIANAISRGEGKSSWSFS